MKVRDVVALLLAQDQEAECTLFTGWEGLNYMTPEGVEAVPDGMLGDGPIVMMYSSRPDELFDPRPPPEKPIVFDMTASASAFDAINQAMKGKQS